MSLTIETNLEAFNTMLGRYMALTSKLPDEVLEKKGRDLGIRLYRKFSEKKWGGPGKNRTGLAKAELAERTSEGRGTHVRRSLVQEYLGLRSKLRAELRSIDGIKGMNRTRLRSIKRRVRLWQQFVGKEIALRQRGIGVLAASFLWFRSRSSHARGTYYVRNKTGRPLGFAEKGDGFMRIVGLQDGLSEVDTRYGLVASALSEGTADMLTYVQRKERELFGAAFGGIAV